MPTPGDDAASPVNIPNWLAQQGESAEELDFPQQPVTHHSENLETSVEYEAASDDRDSAETSNDPAASSTYDGDASPSYPPSPPQQPTLIRDPRIATAIESTRNAIEQHRKIPDWYEIIKAYTARPGEKTKEDSAMLFQLLDNAAKRDLYMAQELQARMSEIRLLVAERHISIPRAVGDYSPASFNQSLWTMREGPTWATTPMAPPVTIFKRPLHNLSWVPFAGSSFRYSSNLPEANPSPATESMPRPHPRDHSPASFNRYPWTMGEGPTWATTPMVPPVSIFKRPRAPAHEGGATAPLQGPASEADAKPKVPDFSWVLSARPSDRHPSNRPEAGPSRTTKSPPHTSVMAGDSQPPRKRRRVRNIAGEEDYSYMRYPTVSELAERLRAREDLLLAEAHRPHSGFKFVWPPV